ncbi:hypothetical protein VOLCADRAFT_107960 [Volvox carteri f. nagariensis]|uniref:Glycosyltransferase 2-like domain-containing protein n=1 Tax=Volvox carteri f. nagariensis TaxID=3068 RepID=D8UHG3_VOLCA|nr:uncharacterized protein VOLCADRAFT_107960 [Volvox carteri f. nagariensis]EFJ40820.1 hypothetical protein VOLCADRAFT_107960 [Volvox carteri f. nagariensis]|eukprot:XP_002958089.1 hypothetical protein VOLCADRAFT_107960 [Volvox carteri f. nagariensis]
MRMTALPRTLAGLTCILLLNILAKCAGDTVHLKRLPYCEERLSKLPQHQPELLILRDLFQTWLMHRRIEVDMEALLQKMRDPPKEIQEQFAWRTSWNESYVAARKENAASVCKETEGKIVSLVKDLRQKELIAPTTTVQDLACNQLVPSQFLINVDSPQEGQRWADLSWSTNGFVVPVMSYNVHELRGYNRLASVARGKYLVLLQDDDLMQPSDCSWLPKLVQQFEAMPSLAMVGMNSFQLSHGPGNERDARNFKDPNTGNNMIFAFQVDLAPLAIRRSAFKAVGGLDEGMSDPGECGIWSDWELSIRFWVAGYHVAYMPLISKMSNDPSDPGGTHKTETGVRCWGRQQNIASSVYMARWGAGWGNGPGKFLELLENYVRLVNLKVLQGLYTQCPFRKGCALDGDPPLPAEYRDYLHEDKPMVQA